MPRNVSLSDSKCWNGGHEWVKTPGTITERYRMEGFNGAPNIGSLLCRGTICFSFYFAFCFSFFRIMLHGSRFLAPKKFPFK